MAREQRYNLTETDRRVLREDHRQIQQIYSERRPPRGRWGGTIGGGHREGVLDEALEPATNILTGATTAELSVYIRSGDNLQDGGKNVLLTNRSLDLSANAGTYVIAAWINGEWRPIWVDCSPTNEVQTITITGGPTGGTFPLTFQDETATIDYDYTAAEVQADLEALSSIGAGNVSCTGGPLPGTAVDVEFQGDLANTNVPKLLTDSDSLTGGTDPEVTVDVDTEGCCG